MSLQTDAVEPGITSPVKPKRKSRYDPDIDREPMRLYIERYRADEPKAKAAGFETVGKWRKAGCPEPKAA